MMDQFLIKLSTLLKYYDDMNFGERLHVTHLLRHQSSVAVAVARRHRTSPAVIAFFNALKEFYPDHSSVVKVVLLD